MPAKTDTIWSAHHASHNFNDRVNGIDYGKRTALTPVQQERFSDYHSGLAVPTNGILTTRSEISRALCELNRKRDAVPRQKDFGKVFQDGKWHDDKHTIWLPGQEPTPEQHEQLLKTYFDPYNDRILKTLQKAKSPVVVVAFDNTADYKIGVDADGHDRMMMNIDLGNDGVAGTADIDAGSIERGIVTTCDPRFLEEFAHQLSIALREQGLCPDVTLNDYDDDRYDQVGELARRFSTRRVQNLDVSQPVHSLQVEYNTNLTDPRQDLTLDFPRITKLKVAHERAMYATYTCLLTHSVHVIRPTATDHLKQ